jgi:uncharacterized protein YhaN
VSLLKIEELHIYGYGKFENQHFYLGKSNLLVFYGENEAGKSTIMSFIHSILFGFPTKQQAENRYEPKRATSYGGYLILRGQENRRLKVERVPGKFGGQVIIEMEDGTTRDEEYLGELLSGLDKETYRSIFSFDVHGLQQIHKMSSDQVGKFLFLSSIYGADALFTIEDKLTKQQELIYKPNGKKPTLNEELVELKDRAAKMLEAKRKNSEYEELLKAKESLKEKLSQIVVAKRESMSLQRELERIKSVIPLIKERNWCIEQLNSLPDTEQFPEDAIQQLDQLNMSLQPIEVKLNSLKSNSEQVNKELDDLLINEAYIQNKKAIQESREQFALYDEKRKKHLHLIKRMEQLQYEIDLLKQRLYPHSSDEEILEINATIPMKEAIKKIIHDDQQAKQRKQLLDEQFEQSRISIEETEWKINELHKEALPDEERKNIEQKVDKYKNVNTNQLQQEREQLLKELTRRKKEHKQEKSQGSMLLTFLVILSLIGIVWSFIQQHWILLIVCIALGVSFILQVKNKKTKKDPLLQHLTMELEKIEENFKKGMAYESSSSQSLPELIHLLDHDQKIKQTLHHEQLLFQQQERTYERIVKQYEEWEKTQFQLKQKLANLAKLLKIDEHASSEALLEAFELLQQLQHIILEKNKFIAEENLIQQELLKYEQMVGEITNACDIEENSIEQAVYELTKKLAIEETKNEKQKHLLVKRKELDEELREYVQNSTFLTQQKGDLIKSSGCETVDEFRKQAKLHQQREEVRKQKQWIDKQLATEKDIDIETLSKAKIDDIEVRLQEVEERLNDLEASERELQQEQSSTLMKLEEMEQSGTYSNLRHSFENKKAVVKEEAEKWIVRALAKDLLQKTVQRHREEKLPELMTSITYFFTRLTSNAYHNVYLPNDKQSFIVERHDGTKFFAEELSQATSEQLYLSIRLAIIKNINKQLNLPIIMDDSFVHFDQRRTSNTIQILNELKEENQVIYFTCHEHVANSYQSQNMVNLSQINVS